MGYTYRYKTETSPRLTTDDDLNFHKDLRENVGECFSSGDPVKLQPNWIREDFVFQGNMHHNYHTNFLNFSDRWSKFEIRVWCVGEECWDDYSGNRGDISLTIFKKGKMIATYGE